MNLESLSVAIRPRSYWEAMDIGWLMARRWYGSLLMAWLVLTLPWLVLGLVMDYTMQMVMFIWWLKPIWERALLFILSRALFGEVPTLRQTMAAFPKLAAKQWFVTLTWRRFSMSRAMFLPVLQLENLAGVARSRRINTLEANQRTGARWLMTICVHLEMAIVLSLPLLVLAFIPEEVQFDYEHMMHFLFEEQQILYGLCVYLAMLLVAPFYVAGGFSLYLHKRIWLEGWDIEIIFRRLQNRIATIKPLLISCILLLLVINPQPNFAAEMGGLPKSVEQVQAQQQIHKIIQEPDFHKIENEWKLEGLGNWFDGEEDKTQRDWSLFKGFFDFLAANIRLMLWAVALAIIVIFLLKNRAWLARFAGWRLPGADDAEPPTQLFGLDVREESLPDDVVAAVMQQWQQQQYRAAYALLYRAALSRLINQYGMKLRACDTEQECAEQVVREQSGDLARYFQRLTCHWQSMAYAHQMPNDALIQQLCAQWPQYFAQRAAHEA